MQDGLSKDCVVALNPSEVLLLIVHHRRLIYATREEFFPAVLLPLVRRIVLRYPKDQLGIRPQLSREVNKQIGDLIKDMEVDQEER